jgi:hypothetical protein
MTLHLVHPSKQRGRLTAAELDALDRWVDEARREAVLDQIRRDIRPRVLLAQRRAALRRLFHAIGEWLGRTRWARH